MSADACRPKLSLERTHTDDVALVGLVRASSTVAKVMHMTAIDGDRNESPKEFIKSITVTDREIQAAARLLAVIASAEDDRGRELTTIAKAGTETRGDQDRSLLRERARRIFVDRARRPKIFSSTMFGEAAWDMLLALYVTDKSGARHSVSGLVNLAGTPATTALRWLNFLEMEQLVLRRPNPLDGRVSRIELTDKARGLLDEYFSSTESEGM